MKCLCLGHGALVIKVPRTGDRGGEKPKGEPGHACSWLPVHLSARVARCTKPQPPVLLEEGVSGAWRCRWIEGGLKGSLSSRWWKARSHTAVLLGLCFQVQGMHPSLVLMPTAHASLCPGSKDLADVQPYHLNPVYNIGSRFSFSNGLVYWAILVDLVRHLYVLKIYWVLNHIHLSKLSFIGWRLEGNSLYCFSSSSGSLKWSPKEKLLKK